MALAEAAVIACVGDSLTYGVIPNTAGKQTENNYPAALNALLGDWPAASVTVPFGSSSYRLVCDRTTAHMTLDGHGVEGHFIEMVDDRREHVAFFPMRNEE